MIVKARIDICKESGEAANSLPSWAKTTANDDLGNLLKSITLAPGAESP